MFLIYIENHSPYDSLHIKHNAQTPLSCLHSQLSFARTHHHSSRTDRHTSLTYTTRLLTYNSSLSSERESATR